MRLKPPFLVIQEPKLPSRVPILVVINNKNYRLLTFVARRFSYSDSDGESPPHLCYALPIILRSFN